MIAQVRWGMMEGERGRDAAAAVITFADPEAAHYALDSIPSRDFGEGVMLKARIRRRRSTSSQASSGGEDNSIE